MLFLITTYETKKGLFKNDVSLLLRKIREALDPGDKLPEEFNLLLSEKRYKETFPLLEEKIATLSELKNVRYSIYYKSEPEFVLGGDFESEYVIRLRTNNIIIKLGFPDYNLSYHLQKIWIQILVSFIFTSLLIVSSYYTIFTLIKQNRLSKMKEQFINNMTHELKTPIFSISIAAKTMFKFDVFDKNEKLKKYLNLIYSENERLKHNVKRVLEMSLLKSEKIEFLKEVVDVHNILNILCEELKLIDENATISKTLNATNYHIEIDPLHLKNVIYNIFDNSLKYSDKNLDFNISTKSTERQVTIVFADNGIGLSKKDQKNIFNEFFRVNTENIHNIKGFGLGLSYVKMIVEKFNGSVSVESTNGTQIKIEFPVI